MRSKRLSHFFGFLRELANDSRFAGSPLNVRLSRFVISRARRRRRRRARVSRGREERCARARKICETRSRRRRSIRSGRERARARDFFSARTHTPRRNTFQEKEGREKEVKFLLERNRPQCANAFDARSKTFYANAKNSSSPFHSTIFTAQNVGDIVEYRDASSSKTSSIKSALSHRHGDGKRHERQFPEVRGF